MMAIAWDDMPVKHRDFVMQLLENFLGQQKRAIAASRTADDRTSAYTRLGAIEAAIAKLEAP